MLHRLAFALLLLPFPALAEDIEFVGPWKTTHPIQLDGIMTCKVTTLGEDLWQGHFFGVWQGSPFEYRVKFKGKHNNLTGTATIDNADYQWTGKITREDFKGTYIASTGRRYKGSFDMKVKAK